MSKVMIVKLVSGEDIISTVVEDADKIELHRPALIMFTPQGLGLIEFPPFPAKNKDVIIINSSCVMFMLEPDTEIINAYNTRFGSGIVVATNKVDISGNNSISVAH